jgi:oligopeptide transport system ATP-binding protein
MRDESITAPALLRVRDLVVEYQHDGRRVRAVDGVTLEVRSQEIVAVVGESGCGKSTLARAIVGIIRRPLAAIEGRIDYDGRDLVALTERDRRALRGNDIAFVPQDARAALNPVRTIGSQIAEIFVAHGRTRRRAARAKAVELLEHVGVPEPTRRARQYPHELSGGQRQRAVIAMAIALTPRLLVADEPTTALDVTVQAQLLELLVGLQREYGLAIVFIIHDLGIVERVAHRVAVLYAGRVVDVTDTAKLQAPCAHPYTTLLLASAPRFGSRRDLVAVPGRPPALDALPSGCAFHPRCPLSEPRCAESVPTLAPINDARSVACHVIARRHA